MSTQNYYNNIIYFLLNTRHSRFMHIFLIKLYDYDGYQIILVIRLTSFFFLIKPLQYYRCKLSVSNRNALYVYLVPTLYVIIR